MSPWVRIDENAMDHPKFLALTDGAWRLWCEGLSYCQKHLTDGTIPFVALKGFRYYSPSRLKGLLAESVPGKGPCWYLNAGGIYAVHDYLDWNDSREEVLAARDRARGRRRKYDERAERVPNAVPNADETPSRTESETRSVSSGVVCRDVFEANTGKRSSHARTGSGVMGGSLPRDHLRHSWCSDRVCVPDFIHGQLLGQRGGDRQDADEWLKRTWYPSVIARHPGTIGLPAEKFWPREFAIEFPPADEAVSKRTLALMRGDAAFLNWAES